MTKEELKTLERVYLGVNEVRDEFGAFREHVRVQLLASQFQFLQSLATIILAIVAFVVAIRYEALNYWFLIALLCAAFLVIYTLTFIRERIDREDRVLNEIADSLQEERTLTEKKVIEAIEKDNYQIFREYVQTRVRNTPTQASEQLSYAGEISIALFVASFLLCLVAILRSYNFLLGVSNILIIVFILCSSILLSFKNWSWTFTEFLSRLFARKVF